MNNFFNKNKHYKTLTVDDKILGGGLFFFALIILSINYFVYFGVDLNLDNTTEDGSYDHCSSIRAEQFLYSNSRAIKSQLQNVTLYSEKGNIFTFEHISYPYNQLRNLECITKVICQSDGSYAIYDVDCKTF